MQGTRAMRMTETTPIVHADVQAMARACADRIEHLARQAQEAGHDFHLALSGGSTPAALYRELAAPERRGHVDWDRVQVFFGDERAVPPDHADSNFRMARETLLDQVPLPAANIHPIQARPDRIEADAAAYEALLRRTLPTGPDGLPRFDLVLLGTGPDGHTASLFPGTPALEERQRLVVPVWVERLESWRISLSYPVLDAARHIMVLVAGSGKVDIVRALFVTHADERRYPIQRIQPSGCVEWHLDRAAARGLEPA